MWVNIYKVYDNRTNQHFSLKLFQHIDAQTLYEKFSAEEMHRITQLSHPNLVKVLSFGNMGNHIYSVSELYEGKSLQSYNLKINRLNILYDGIVQCLYALHALHSQNVFHKDLKPSNILYRLVDEHIEVKLIDYGFNKLDADINQQSLSGTLPYIAPELYQEFRATAQSDFYALGVTLYKLTTGIFPFSLEQISAIRSGTQHNFFPKFIREINPDIPLGLEKFILKLCEKNPVDRFVDVQSAISFLNKIQSTPFAFSQRISLLQSVNVNSYIVRSNYAHRLVDLVQSLEVGRGNLISLIGSYGSGKDNILTLLKYHFLSNKFYIFDYTCTENHRDPIFALIKEFGTSLNFADDNIYFHISERFRKYLEEAESERKAKKVDTKKNKEDFQSAREFIEHLSDEKPLIFIIRKAHLLTDLTVSFIQFLSDLIAEKPIMIILSANDHTVVKKLKNIIQIKVDPLSFEEASMYISGLMSSDTGDEFIENILYRSSGNPYFIREILRDLLQKKLLFKNNQIDFCFSFGDYRLPEHLMKSIYDRIYQLDEKNIQHLKKLAIVDTPLKIKLLIELLGLSHFELFRLLQDSINFEILIEENGVLNFTFPEIKQYFLKKCSKREVVDISQKLISYFDNETELDIETCQGIIANATYSNDYKAIRKYRRVLFDLYTASWEQIKAYHEIYSILKLDISQKIKISDKELGADLMLFVEQADLTGYVDEALKFLLKHQKSLKTFDYYYSLASLYLCIVDLQNSEKYLEKAKLLIKNKEQQQRYDLDIVNVQTLRGDCDTAMTILKAFNVSTSDLKTAVKYYDRYGACLVAMQKEEDAIAWFEEHIARLEKYGKARLGFLYNRVGVLYSRYKMFAEAEKMYYKCKAEWELINYDRFLGAIYSNIADMYLWQGNTTKSLEYLDKADTYAKKTNNTRHMAFILVNFAETYIKLGKFVEAELYLSQAVKICEEIGFSGLGADIENNMALAVHKTHNFFRFYTKIETNHHHILEKKINTINPVIKSYIFYLFELGDKETIDSLLYSDFPLTQIKDQDFYYQLLAMLSILKGDYHIAINNYAVALEYAKKSMSLYSIAIIYINLAIAHTLNNETDKAIDYLDRAEPLTSTHDYLYWSITAQITRIKISFLKKNISLRMILRDALKLLPDVKLNHYFLLEIELYGILIHLYNELNATKHAQSHYKTYTEKVRDAIRYLPERDQKRFISLKKASLKNINDFNVYKIVSRKSTKPTDWNYEILTLLTIEDVERIKFFLREKIKQYFSPHLFAIVMFKSNTTTKTFTKSNYSIYLSDNFSDTLLDNEEIIRHIYKAINSCQTLQIAHDGKNFIISPIMLKHSKIGFMILSDSGEMPFTAIETKMISSFCFHLSTMLIRLSEFEEENLKISLMKDLMKVTGNMMQNQQLDKLEHDFVYHIIKITKASRGFLIKKDKNGNMQFSVAIDSENRLLTDVSNISQTVISDVLTYQHHLFLVDFVKGHMTDEHHKHQLYAIDNQANSLYCAPIMEDNTVYALLYLDNYPEQQSNLKIVADMMDIFLHQVSMALHNAKNYQTLMDKNLELYTLDTMKNNFNAIVSHELNTPLYTLSEYMQKLVKIVSKVDPDTVELLSKVDKNLKKLNKIVSEIVTLNTLNKSSELPKQKCNLIEVLTPIYEEIKEQSRDRKMRFYMDIASDLPAIWVDASSIEILIRHLLYNAVRFTADYGNITLCARESRFPHEMLDEHDSIVIFVSDNGIGIAEKEQENIFKPFFELGDIYSHRSGFLEFRSGGLGVGLAIAQRVCELHGGKIWSQSKENEGTTIFVSLPITI
jgi:signal transduction histidine kinase/tetratricopeptide (TPR) repeat protein